MNKIFICLSAIVLTAVYEASAWSCSQAPGCGVQLTSFNGVGVYSNGADQCSWSCCAGDTGTGCSYQCVELAQRYFRTFYGTPGHWAVNTADQMCYNYPAGVSLTSNPQPGDLIVLAGTIHVAVITAVSGGTVYVVEQNASPNGYNSYSTSQASCFLTASGSGGSSGGLACPGNGYYCGSDGVQGGSANTLYLCQNGRTVSHQACSGACVVMPSYYSDQCASGSCAGVGNGFYCGNDEIGGQSNVLYDCSGGRIAWAGYCTYGCQVSGAGYSDYCKNYGGGVLNNTDIVSGPKDNSTSPDGTNTGGRDPVVPVGLPDGSDPRFGANTSDARALVLMFAGWLLIVAFFSSF